MSLVLVFAETIKGRYLTITLLYELYTVFVIRSLYNKMSFKKCIVTKAVTGNEYQTKEVFNFYYVYFICLEI